MAARGARAGRSKWMIRSKRPGRRRAGSRAAARLVAATSRMLAGLGPGRGSWRWVGSSRLRLSESRASSRRGPVGSSKLCICTSSSLTTPGTPSWAEPDPEVERAAPMASNSSMNPMAPPSERAALRSALKNARILRLVWP